MNQRIEGRGRRGHRDHHERIGRLREALFSGRGSVRRGNVRSAVLSVLAERPMHGYQVMQELESRTAGRWRPSPGSIYPTLQLLQDEGLVSSEEVDGRRTFTLTDTGRDAAAESRLPRGSWADGSAETADLRKLALQAVHAAIQVQRIGSPEANRAARDILLESRRRLYGLLADDAAEPTATDGAEAMA
jgi:DNA-binding PadR family transcriptional regulator